MTVSRSTGRPPGSGAVRRAHRRARQRRVLSKIEYMLGRTDPPLTSKFEMFSRLARGEEMPWIEQVTASTHRGTGNMAGMGGLSYLLRVVVCVAVAAGALVTTILAGGAAFARRAPVSAAQGYSVQSEGAPRLAAPAAGSGLTAPLTQKQLHAGRPTKQVKTGASDVDHSAERIVLPPDANGSAGLAGGEGHGRVMAMSGLPGTPRSAAASWPEVPCAR